MTLDRSSAIEDTTRLAIAGDRNALEEIVRLLQPDLYGLALRMLWNREDAEDATQEILIRVVTRLSQFDFRSRLKTWAYRVAANYLLDVKKSATERLRLTFEQFSDDLLEGLTADEGSDAERSLLVEEVKLGCTLGMLQCLDRAHRIAYIVGEILEFSSPEAKTVLEIPEDVFRKRLQRARAAIAEFTKTYCGLVSDTASCHCSRRIRAAVDLGRVNPERLQFATQAQSFAEARATIRLLENVRLPLAVHRSGTIRHPDVDFARRLLAALDGRVAGDRAT
jgi:RNA polymerase sigma factor (sigma-70 family)